MQAKITKISIILFVMFLAFIGANNNSMLAQKRISNKTNAPFQQAFSYTGSDQTWTVPVGVTSVRFEIWGAGGGKGYYDSSYAGGSGGYVRGTLTVTPGEVYTIVVGQGGLASEANYYGCGGDATYGGGGYGTSGDAPGGSGGGLSGIFSGSSTLTFNAAGQARSIAIAGGGGATCSYAGGGGAGGGLTGGAGTNGSSNYGKGGTQLAGGTGTSGADGSALKGGNGDASGTRCNTQSADGGGGGGGYWGGEGGYSDATPGGGGSGYLHPSLVTLGSNEQGTSGSASSTPFPPGVCSPYYESGVGIGGWVTGQGVANGGHGRVVLYIENPNVATISSFSPTTASNGMQVVITGTKFTGATQVSFGGTAATSYTVNSDTQITATVAAGATGCVSVLTPNGGAAMSGFTYVNPPTTQAYSVNNTSTTENQSYIYWTRGNGVGCAVFMAATSTGSAAPVNASNYSANSSFYSGNQIGTSGWYCVYKGTGGNVTVTNLIGATTYRVMVFEYNGSANSESFNLNTASNNPKNFTTSTPAITNFVWNGSNNTNPGTSQNWNENATPAANANLTIPKLSGVSPVYPQLSTDMTIGKLVVKAGAQITVNTTKTLTANDSVLLESDDNYTAQILNNGAVNHTNAKLLLRKSFKASSGWYFMSFPYNVPIGNIKRAGTQTTASTSSFLTATGPTYSDIYIIEYNGDRRDQTGTAVTSNSPNWDPVTSGTLQAGKGYAFLVMSDKAIDFVSATGSTGIFDAANKATTVGTYTANSNAAHNSWNLVGVPYTSAFNLANLDQNTFYYLYSQVGQNYDVKERADSYQLYPFSAFFMQASATTLNFAAVGRALKVPVITNETAYDEIDLQISNTTFSDRTRIRIANNAQTGYTINEDAVKMLSPNSAVPQLWSKSDVYDLAINALPIATSEIQLNYRTGSSGTYSIRLQNAENFKTLRQILLVDNVTKKSIDLKATDYYTFTAEQGKNTERFKIVTVPDINTSNITVFDHEISAIIHSNNLTINGLQSSSDVQIFDLKGVKINTYKQVVNGQTLVVNSNAKLIFVTINNKFQNYTLKILNN